MKVAVRATEVPEVVKVPLLLHSRCLGSWRDLASVTISGTTYDSLGDMAEDIIPKKSQHV